MEDKEWIDIPDVAKKLQLRAESILKDWFPNGKKLGNEFLVGSLNGEAGQSLRINMGTGQWADFSNQTDRGGDLVSLYAAKEQTTQLEAAKILAGEHNIRAKKERIIPKKKLNDNGNGHDSNVVSIFDPFHDNRYGKPTDKWLYRKNGMPYFWVCRYDFMVGEAKKKTYKQLVQRDDGIWIVGLKEAGIPKPYPLFSDKIETDTILIVEGEKACVSARKISPFDVVTWPLGVSNVKNADWSPVYGKKIIIWPDNDKAGHEAAQILKTILKEHTKEIKIVNTSGFKSKYDAHDFMSHGKTWNHVTYQKHELLELSLNNRGEPYANESNVRIAMQHGKLKDMFWYDEFRCRRMFDGRRFQDADYLKTLVYFQGDLAMHTVAKTTIQWAIQYECERNRRNPVKEYFENLKWDGTPRVKDYMHTVYGATKTSYVTEVSKNFFLAIVARILDPGCKFDHMIILEGKQGIKKSMSLKALATEEFYWDCSESMDSKDFVRGLKGKMIVEISELNSILKSDTEMVKKTLSCSIDEYVEKYETEIVTIPRTCVLVGTTNEKEYLKDTTGNRRFWPIRVEKEADLEYIKENREQLFAEAVYRYRQGENYWEFKEEEAKKEVIQQQEDRLIVDEWTDKISEIVALVSETTASYVIERMGIPIERVTRREQIRVGQCLRSIGFKNTVKRGDDGKTKRVWVKE